MLTSPTWHPSPFQPPEPPPGRPRYVGILVLALLAAVVGAAAYVLRDTPPEETVDDAELNRLIADKQAELSMAERESPTVSGANDATSLLYVDSNPAGAFVLLDADTVGITPINGRTVKTGVYVLSIRKENYAPHDTVVFVLEEEASPRFFADLAPEGSYLRNEPLIASPDRTAPGASRLAETGSRERGETQPPRRQPASARERTASAADASGSAGELTVSITAEPSERSSRSAANQRSAPPQSPGAQTSNEPTPPLTGLVTVLVRPWGSIYIDGHLEKVNTDVQHTAALPEGRHVVRVEHPALGTREQVVDIRNGAPRQVVFDLLKSDVSESEPQKTAPERAERGSGNGSSGNDGS